MERALDDCAENATGQGRSRSLRIRLRFGALSPENAELPGIKGQPRARKSYGDLWLAGAFQTCSSLALMACPESISRVVPRTATPKKTAHIVLQRRDSSFAAFNAQPASTTSPMNAGRSAGGTLSEKNAKL